MFLLEDSSMFNVMLSILEIYVSLVRSILFSHSLLITITMFFLFVFLYLLLKIIIQFILFFFEIENNYKKTVHNPNLNFLYSCSYFFAFLWVYSVVINFESNVSSVLLFKLSVKDLLFCIFLNYLWIAISKNSLNFMKYAYKKIIYCLIFTISSTISAFNYLNLKKNSNKNII